MDESFIDMEEPDWDIGLDKHTITARTKGLQSEEIWSYNFKSRISKAWIYRRDLQNLRPLSLFMCKFSYSVYVKCYIYYRCNIHNVSSYVALSQLVVL